jgi:hypothetical protein
MSQSTVLVGVMLGAFVVFLAANNRLSVYWQILLGGGGSSGGSSATNPTGTAPGTLLNPFAPGAGQGGFLGNPSVTPAVP